MEKFEVKITDEALEDMEKIALKTPGIYSCLGFSLI
jgi:hypothetical protein